MKATHKIFEGLERSDLKNLITPILTIDEYKSKMGEDEDICVLCFTVLYKEPAFDLSSFIERRCDWVLDSEVSSGELEDGKFLVFVEAERTDQLAEDIVLLIESMLNLTDQSLEEWVVKYPQTKKECKVSVDELREMIPLSPESYKNFINVANEKQLESLQLAAGINVDTVAPKNELTDAIRLAAGLRINGR
jgi:hypothetical protein